MDESSGRTSPDFTQTAGLGMREPCIKRHAMNQVSELSNVGQIFLCIRPQLIDIPYLSNFSILPRQGHLQHFSFFQLRWIWKIGSFYYMGVY